MLALAAGLFMAAPATAYWMNRSICRSSFLAIQRVASKSRTSPAMRVGYAEASNRVIVPMPDSPAHARRQLSCTPMPRGLRTPIPVMTTLRVDIGPSGAQCFFFSAM